MNLVKEDVDSSLKRERARSRSRTPTRSKSEKKVTEDKIKTENDGDWTGIFTHTSVLFLLYLCEYY